MNLEIEKKFLLRRLPKLEFTGEKRITQCYVWSEEKQDYDRYRQSLDLTSGTVKYFHTFKKRLKAGVQEEYEEEVSADLFKYHFYEKNCDLYIQKYRNLYKKGDLTWEIDQFLGMSLIIAELELPTEDYKFKIPKKIDKEIILEVTDFTQFYNSNLALKMKK